jgi:predicted Zn-ribbon and HTH transcriptional regulator
MDKELSAWEKYKENLGESRPWHLLDKENYIEEDLAKERFSICKACPELIKLTTQCKKCGCFMAAKTKLKTASCPIGKW